MVVMKSAGEAAEKKRQKELASMPPVDGDLKVFRIEDFKEVLLPESEHGKFFSGDSYILHFSYKKPSGNAVYHILYFWLGRKSTADEMGAAALITTRMDDELGGCAEQVHALRRLPLSSTPALGSPFDARSPPTE